MAGPLFELFDASLLGRADVPALELGAAGGPIRTLTFGELETRSNRMAHALAARGLRAGDRLALQLTNGLEFLELFLGCLKLGALMVPVNVLYRERELRHITSGTTGRAKGALLSHANLAANAGVLLEAWPARRRCRRRCSRPSGSASATPSSSATA